jgi:hypothetical protein
MFKNKKPAPFKRISDPILKQRPTTAKIKVQLDSRTCVTIHDISALALWLVRYPEAKVIS